MLFKYPIGKIRCVLNAQSLDKLMKQILSCHFLYVFTGFFVLCAFLKLMLMSWLLFSETFQQVVSQICPACHDESAGIGVSAEERALSGFGIGKSKKQYGA